MNQLYVGWRNVASSNEAHVYVLRDNGVGLISAVQPLNPRTDLINHSEAFEWGYAGSGPAQLAFALCMDALGDDSASRAFYQVFKDKVVSDLPDSHWTLTGSSIRAHHSDWLKERDA